MLLRVGVELAAAAVKEFAALQASNGVVTLLPPPLEDGPRASVWARCRQDVPVVAASMGPYGAWKIATTVRRESKIPPLPTPP